MEKKTKEDEIYFNAIAEGINQYILQQNIENGNELLNFLIACEYEPRAGHLTHLTFSGNQLEFSDELKTLFTFDREIGEFLDDDAENVYNIINASYVEILSNLNDSDYITNLFPTIPEILIVINSSGSSIFDWHINFQKRQISDYNDYHEKKDEDHDYLCLVLVYRCFQELRDLDITEENIEKLNIFRQFIDSISYYEYYPQEINYLKNVLDLIITDYVEQYNRNGQGQLDDGAGAAGAAPSPPPPSSAAGETKKGNIQSNKEFFNARKKFFPLDLATEAPPVPEAEPAVAAKAVAAQANEHEFVEQMFKDININIQNRFNSQFLESPASSGSEGATTDYASASGDSLPPSPDRVRGTRVTGPRAISMPTIDEGSIETEHTHGEQPARDLGVAGSVDSGDDSNEMDDDEEFNDTAAGAASSAPSAAGVSKQKQKRSSGEIGKEQVTGRQRSKSPRTNNNTAVDTVAQVGDVSIVPFDSDQQQNKTKMDLDNDSEAEAEAEAETSKGTGTQEFFADDEFSQDRFGSQGGKKKKKKKTRRKNKRKYKKKTRRRKK